MKLGFLDIHKVFNQNFYAPSSYRLKHLIGALKCLRKHSEKITNFSKSANTCDVKLQSIMKKKIHQQPNLLNSKNAHIIQLIENSGRSLKTCPFCLFLVLHVGNKNLNYVNTLMLNRNFWLFSAVIIFFYISDGKLK